MSLFDSMLSGFGGGDSKTPKRPNLLDVASRPKKPDPKPFSLSDSIGISGRNHPNDVRKMESGLNQLGFMNTKKTGDSKGQFSVPLRQGMQAFQKANKLAVDGQANVGGPTATTLSQQVKNIRARRAAEEKQARMTKPLAPKPFVAKQPTSPTFLEKPKPWWRTRRPEKMPDEDYSSTRRTMEGMLKYGDDGALPNLYADSIRNGGHKAANELGEFMRQLEEAAPKRVKGFEKAVFNKLNDYEKETYFPETFGKKRMDPAKKTLLGGSGSDTLGGTRDGKINPPTTTTGNKSAQGENAPASKREDRDSQTARERRNKLEERLSEALKKGETGGIDYSSNELQKLKKKKPLAFGEWANSPDPGGKPFLVDPEMGKPMLDAKGAIIRATPENRLKISDLPPINPGTQEFNKGKKPTNIRIVYPNGEMIAPHDKKGQSPAQYYGGGGSLVLSPEEAKELGLGKYTPPPGGWDDDNELLKLYKKLLGLS